jgi:hypothetical protein
MGIFEQMCLVIPVDKTILQGGKKDDEGNEGDDCWDKPMEKQGGDRMNR